MHLQPFPRFHHFIDIKSLYLLHIGRGCDLTHLAKYFFTEHGFTPMGLMSQLSTNAEGMMTLERNFNAEANCEAPR
jgi:hypothetical protein